MATQSISCEAIIAEAFSSRFFKANPHLIDKASIYRWVSLALKKFGTNIMEKREKVIHVKDGRYDLGIDFGLLSLAVWCEPESFFVKGANKDKLLNTFYYKQRIVGTGLEKNECRDIDQNCIQTECIEERYYLHTDEDSYITTYFKNPVYVKLGKQTMREACADNCRNKYVSDCDYTINIKGQTLYATGFKEGSIYLEYYALPVEEINGQQVPLIPKTFQGYLEEFIELHIKRKTLEDAILSDDAQNKITIYQTWYEQEKEAKALALADTSPIGMESIWNAINRKRLDFCKYDLQFQ